MRGRGALRGRHDLPGRQPRRAVDPQRAAAARSRRASSGAGGERVRILLNRAAEPYPIPPKQIETALGYPIHHTFPSDYKTVSTALNSGVPLALTRQLRASRRSSTASRGSCSIRQPTSEAAAPRSGARPRPRASRVHLVTDHEHSLPSLAPPTRRRPPARRAARPTRRAPQYLELKANVHRKLLNRLNLEALAQADRAARRERNPHAARSSCWPRRATPLSLSERETLFGERHRRGVRPRAARAAAARPGDQRHPGQHLQERLRRARRQARARADDVPGRQAPAARHRPHRQRRRPPRRRQLADGRRAPARRLARQRHHSAARGRRPAALDPPFSGRAAARPRTS